MTVCAKAFAKINLFLDITGLDGRGYHLIDSVMQSVTLCDEIIISEISEASSSEICIECDKEGIPCDGSNIAYKAAKAFFESTGVMQKGLNIKLVKNIPHEAGLGGGSADAAAVLAAMNEIFKTSLSRDELCAIGEKIGADVPFCICGGTKRCEGIGERLTEVGGMTECHIVIAKPHFGVSTKRAYEAYDALQNPEKGSIKSILTSLENGDLSSLSDSLFNSFEQVVTNKELSEIKRAMLRNGALGCLMSGSGSAVFALFSDVSDAEKCKAALSGICKEVHLCEPCERGCSLKTI